MRAVPAVAPLAARYEKLRERRFRIEIVPATAGRRRPALLDALDVVVSIDGKVDLVEYLAVGRRKDVVGVWIAAVEGVGEAAQRAGIALSVDRCSRDAVGDRRTLKWMDEKVRHDGAVKAKDKCDHRQREHRDEVPAVEIGLRARSGLGFRYCLR